MSSLNQVISKWVVILGFSGVVALGAGLALAGTETIESEQGRTFTLTYDGEGWTRSVKSAVLCADEPAAFSVFKLWMPDHGHGSTPTKISVVDMTCAKIEKINFVMLGEWELRVATSDGDKASFLVDVK